MKLLHLVNRIDIWQKLGIRLENKVFWKCQEKLSGTISWSQFNFQFELTYVLAKKQMTANISARKAEKLHMYDAAYNSKMWAEFCSHS